MGRKIEFIPSHCCTCINQHDSISVVKDGRLAAIRPTTARGKYYQTRITDKGAII